MSHQEGPPKSLHAFMEDMKLGRAKIRRALEELGFADLPTDTFGYNEAPVLDRQTQMQLISHLRVIPPDEVEAYRHTGHTTMRELAQELGVRKGSLSRYLQVIRPDWTDTLPTFAQGQRRVVLLPPEIVEKASRYHRLAHNRQMLSTWRSMRTRDTLRFYENDSIESFYSGTTDFLMDFFILGKPQATKALLNLVRTLPYPTDAAFGQMKKAFQWREIAKSLEESTDIIHLDNKDRTMFAELSHGSDLASIHLIATHIRLPISISDKFVITAEESARHSLASKSFLYTCKNVRPVALASDSLTVFRETLTDKLTSYMLEIVH